jgi:hypothetical protein
MGAITIVSGDVHRSTVPRMVSGAGDEAVVTLDAD